MVEGLFAILGLERAMDHLTFLLRADRLTPRRDGSYELVLILTPKRTPPEPGANEGPCPPAPTASSTPRGGAGCAA
jgi:hypothetical protein